MEPMEAWIRQTFQVDERGWEGDDGEEPTFCFESGGVRVQARLAGFVQRFGQVTTPPTADALKEVDTDDHLGWHRHFDAWVEQGIIQA